MCVCYQEFVCLEELLLLYLPTTVIIDYMPCYELCVSSLRCCYEYLVIFMTELMLFAVFLRLMCARRSWRTPEIKSAGPG